MVRRIHLALPNVVDQVRLAPPLHAICRCLFLGYISSAAKRTEGFIAITSGMYMRGVARSAEAC